MKPLPDLKNEAAMIARGQSAAMWSAKKDAADVLRDSFTMAQACPWEALPEVADKAIAAGERLKTLAAMWNEL